MRRPRSFWEARVAELDGGRTVERVCQQHGLIPERLRWWRWRLASTPSMPALAITVPRMLEVVPRPSPLAVASWAGPRVLIGDLVLELPPSTPPTELARIIGALRTTC